MFQCISDESNYVNMITSKVKITLFDYGDIINVAIKMGKNDKRSKGGGASNY